MTRTRILFLAAAVAATSVAVGTAIPAAAAPGVDPGAVSLTLAPGESSSLTTNVTTPVIAPKPDIVFLADTTGSMDPVLANVRNNTRSIIDEVRASQPDARFAVADYKADVDGARAFSVRTPLTDDEAAVQDGTQQWLYDVGGGGAPWTDFINAHYQLATGAVGFRPGSTRIIAWFGDARSHDPSLGHPLSDTNLALRGIGAHVVAVPVLGTNGGGLDNLGQATSITKATGGVLMAEQAADQVARAILDGIKALDVTVAPTPACDPGVGVAFDPASRRVRSGASAPFGETVSVAPGTAPGTYRCTVDFRVNGASVGLAQTVTVRVPDSSAAPALRIGDVSVTEGSSGTTPATFTVSLSKASTSAVSVGWATRPGTAVAPADFAAASGTVTFAPGATSASVSMAVVGDRVAEADETFTVDLSAPSGATLADPSGVGTIVDDDTDVPLPTIRIGDVMVPEGNAGQTPASVAVTLSHAATAPVGVSWATAPGSAVDTDFVAAQGRLTFAPGETSKRIDVTVTGDRSTEVDETFSVVLSAPSGATLGDDRGQVTIGNDDGGPPGDVPALRLGDATVVEGGSAVLTVVLDQPSNTPVTVGWATAPGTATTADFTAGEGTVTFVPGTTTAQVSVPVLTDGLPEGDETFTVELSGPTGATLADPTGVVTILDDRTAPTLSIGDVAVAEGSAGTTPATLTVTLSEPAATPVTVGWATAPGTATAADFTAGAGTLTFQPGATSATVQVSVVGDTAVEGDETFTVGLSGPTGATLADPTGTVTILDDDAVPGPALSITDTAVDEGSGRATLIVSLSAPAANPVTVAWATKPGTATPPGDYTTSGATLTFPPGTTSLPVTVPITDDTTEEPAETFTVTLADPTGATLADPTGVVTIADDDTTVPRTIAIGDVSVAEGKGQASFPVTLSAAAGAPVSAYWSTMDGTAGAPGDYAGGSGTVTFPPGTTKATVTVALVDDDLAEPDETFTVTLADPNGAAIADGTGVGTIVNDDAAGRFGCTASALTLLGARPAVANPRVTPCADDDRTAATVRLGLGLLTIEAGGLSARTDLAPGGVSATGALATTRVRTLGLTIEVTTLTATATATCVGGRPAFDGSSEIAALTVNGVRIPIGSQPVTVPLLVGSLSLNKTVLSADGVTQQAFALHTLLGDVVIGEATASTRGNPC